MSRKPDFYLLIGPDHEWSVIATDKDAIKDGLNECDRILLVCEDDGRVSDVTEDLALYWLHEKPFEPVPPCFERYIGDLIPAEPQSRFERDNTAF